MTVREAAARAGRSPQTISTLLWRGKLAGRKVRGRGRGGRRWSVDPQDLVRYLAKAQRHERTLEVAKRRLLLECLRGIQDAHTEAAMVARSVR